MVHANRFIQILHQLSKNVKQSSNTTSKIRKKQCALQIGLSKKSIYWAIYNVNSTLLRMNQPKSDFFFFVQCPVLFYTKSTWTKTSLKDQGIFFQLTHIWHIWGLFTSRTIAILMSNTQLQLKTQLLALLWNINAFQTFPKHC